LLALYGLTDAEARVALALFEGATSIEIARRFCVSLNTVRSQLARTFEKTGARGQADLVRLLARVSTIPIAKRTDSNG
jgi:DNA-binding CsgD family transcriptional regulator